MLSGNVQLAMSHVVPDPELTPLAEVLDQADLLVVGTPHGCYRGLKCRQPVVDVTATV